MDVMNRAEAEVITGIGLVPDDRAQRLRCDQEHPVIWTSTNSVAYRQPMASQPSRSGTTSR
ncbi:hypothetical protein GCM10022207_48350 [Streptomyces lannensis]|uniref:Uncharacterized protein n=1 Tax=Streptomyces lannensis TaxID=766498 RepID=A0ABP7KIC9_9ACTN